MINRDGTFLVTDLHNKIILVNVSERIDNHVF